MPEPMRIGLIEVGSNTIRYLVADWHDMDFERLKIETVKHGMHPHRPTEAAVAEVNRSVETFVSDVRKWRCDRVFVYGTAVCRTIAARDPGMLSPRIRVLAPAEEAMASWVAGFGCTSRAPGTRCTVIDQGSGSTEIVQATWNGHGFEDLAFHSTAVGTVSLLEAFKANRKGHFAASQALIQEMIPAFNETGLSSGDAGTVLLVGGAATSIGWLATKGTGLQNYVPAEMNGRSARVQELQDLYTELYVGSKKDPIRTQRRVDTRPGSQDHLLRVLSSFPFLIVLASFFRGDGQFMFSGYGARHGMAFLIQHDLIGVDSGGLDAA